MAVSERHGTTTGKATVPALAGGEGRASEGGQCIMPRGGTRGTTRARRAGMGWHLKIQPRSAASVTDNGGIIFQGALLAGRWGARKRGERRLSADGDTQRRAGSGSCVRCRWQRHNCKDTTRAGESGDRRERRTVYRVRRFAGWIRACGRLSCAPERAQRQTAGCGQGLMASLVWA